MWTRARLYTFNTFHILRWSLSTFCLPCLLLFFFSSLHILIQWMWVLRFWFCLCFSLFLSFPLFSAPIRTLHIDCHLFMCASTTLNLVLMFRKVLINLAHLLMFNRQKKEKKKKKIKGIDNANKNSQTTLILLCVTHHTQKQRDARTAE